MVTTKQLPLAAGCIALAIAGVSVYALYTRDFATSAITDADHDRAEQTAQAREGSDAMPSNDGALDPSISKLAEREDARAQTVIRLRSSNPNAMARIDKQIALLHSESLDESLDRLDEISSYVWPGVLGEFSDGLAIEFPLTKERGRRDVARVLSNRRVIKVLEELEMLDRRTAADRVSQRIADGLTVYDHLMNQLKQSGALSRVGPKGETLSFQMSDNPNGEPTLLGTRNGLLALALIAGALDLDGARGAVDQIVAKALEQRDEFYRFEDHGYAKECAVSVLASASLYSRPVLVVAMAGTSGRRDLIGSVFHSSDASRDTESAWSTQKVSLYDAIVTPFDLPVFSGSSPDFARGSIDVQYVPFIDDPQFNAVVDVFRGTGKK